MRRPEAGNTLLGGEAETWSMIKGSDGIVEEDEETLEEVAAELDGVAAEVVIETPRPNIVESLDAVVAKSVALLEEVKLEGVLVSTTVLVEENSEVLDAAAIDVVLIMAVVS